MEKYIFISYSTKNTNIAFAVKDFLEDRGYSVWIAPNDIPNGQRYANIIEKSISNCSVAILIMTKDICLSQWVNKEIERAISHGKTVLGLKFSEFELNDEFKFLLSNTQMTGLIKSIDINDVEMAKVLSDLGDVVSGRVPTGEPLKINKYSNVEKEKQYDKSQLIDVSKDLICAFQSGTEAIIEELSVLHFSDVNRYVKQIFATLGEESKDIIYNNLTQAYEAVLLDSNVSGRKEYAIKGQIIYFLTRLFSDRTSNVERLKRYYYAEKNVWQRQSIAYGLASLGEIEVPMDYAKRIYFGGDEEDVNRSWTLVFYGDVSGVDPYIYLDDGTADWINCRQPRITRLQLDEQSVLAYRGLDLAVLYSFYKSRGWLATQYDLDVIKNARIRDKVFTSKQIKLLKQMQKAIVHNCKKAIKLSKKCCQ